MKVSAAVVIACTFGSSLVLAACGSSAATRTPDPAPTVTLTPDDLTVWAPLPPDRSAIPVLLYHGIGPTSDFSNSTDAEYGVGEDDFAKQMTMMKHAGYQTVTLSTFLRFVNGEKVDLPPRPVLLTFDDGRADSWTGADGILAKLGFNAVMFVDVGRVDRHDPEYLTWQELQEMQKSGRWQLQLHAGDEGHQYIQYDSDPQHTGPYYAYKKPGESFDHWRRRVRSDISNGQRTLSRHIQGFEPLAFAPPFGAYGQQGTNDSRIPGDLLGWLEEQYEAVFTQDRNARAHPGAEQPLGRIQVTRAVSGGDLHARLLSGEQ